MSRLGAVVPFWVDRPPDEAIEIGLAAERYGFDELWVGELRTFDAFALAGALARETRRITLVTGPLAAGVRDPVSLALGAASVAALGGRRCVLAVGASSPATVSAWRGREWTGAADRVRETIEALRPILAGGRSSYAGSHVRTEGFRLHAVPTHPIDIAVAAFGPRMLRVAASAADRVVVNLLTPAQVRSVRDEIARLAPGTPPPLTAWVPAALEPGPASLAQLRGQLAMYLAPPGYGEKLTECGFGELVAAARSGTPLRELAAAIPVDLLARICALGGATEVRARIDEYRRAGADTVAIVPVTADDPGGVRLLGTLARETQGWGGVR